VFVAACVMVIHNLFWNYIHLYFIIIELDLTALDNGCSNVIAHAYVTLLVICPNPLDAWIWFGNIHNKCSWFEWME
jgi:hypothetical protein